MGALVVQHKRLVIDECVTLWVTVQQSIELEFPTIDEGNAVAGGGRKCVATERQHLTRCSQPNAACARIVRRAKRLSCPASPVSLAESAPLSTHGLEPALLDEEQPASTKSTQQHTAGLSDSIRQLMWLTGLGIPGGV